MTATRQGSMRVVLFCHSLLSDWNHGNAHFLRGVVSELVARGHDVDVYEPEDAWSAQNLIREHGPRALEETLRHYPAMRPRRYLLEELDLRQATAGADLVLAHEWNPPELINALAGLRASGGDFILVFHDTHHRAVTAPAEMARYALHGYDAVLAFGARIRDLYLERGWARRVFVWHEAADPRVFAPRPHVRPSHDLVWIGNWGDEERTSELEEFLLRPVQQLRLKARVYGVRYPDAARRALESAGIEYRGWLPNYRVPEALAQARLTVHIPRRPYAEALPGIPTIRPFEALACGTALVSAPWWDTEGLFRPGQDFRVARNGDQMREHLTALLADDAARASMAAHGRRTVLARHTCRHRVDQLLDIYRELGGNMADVAGVSQ